MIFSRLVLKYKYVLISKITMQAT